MTLTPLEPWIAEKIGRSGQPLTRGDLERYQLRQLHATLELARERSAFYRKHLADTSTHLAQLHDLTHLPFTTADDIRANPLAFVCGSQDAIKRIVTLDSSGTTGAPKRLYFTEDDQELTIDFFRAGMSTFTGPGDRVLILLPGDTPGSVGDLLATALTRLGAVWVKHGPVRDAGRTLEVMEAEAVTGIVGVPVHVLALVRHPTFRRTSTTQVRSVLLSTDYISNAIKRAIEDAWGCTVYNHYGMTETGLGGGVECKARTGYHLREADLYYEVIDPQTGRTLPDGEQGEVVFTTLTRQGMPLIRYRTGDVGRMIPGPCACGTVLKTLARIATRLNGRISIGDGLLTMADLDEAIFPIGDVLNFTAAIARDAGHYSLRLAVKFIDSERAARTQEAGASVRQAVEALPVVRAEVANRRLDVVVEAANVIPPSMAKRAIVDLGNRPTAS